METFLENMHLTRDRAYITYYSQQLAPVLRHTHLLILFLYGNTFSGFFHILNIPTYVSHNHLMPSQINYTFSNLAGDALLNIIHRVPLFLYLGHHGDLHHHPHHQQPFAGPYTRTTLLQPDINLTDQYRLTNRALWICRTPACNAPLRLCDSKEDRLYGNLLVIQRGVKFSFHYFHVILHCPLVILLICSLAQPS